MVFDRVFVIYFFVALLGLQMIESLRVVVIGDSVDRYMVEAWCVANNGTLVTEANLRTDFSENNGTLAFLRHRFRDLTFRHNAWEFRVCQAPLMRTNVSFVMNKCGVSTNGPFWTPIRTTKGIETELETSKSVKETLQISLGPALHALSHAKVLGGAPDAVILQSAFWDLGRLKDTLVPYGRSPQGQPQLGRWVRGWLANATMLMAAVQEEVFATAYFWREATVFGIAAGEWNNKQAHAALVQMRKVISPYTEKRGYTFVPVVSKVSGSHQRRDLLHPSPTAALQMFAFALQFVKNHLKNKRESLVRFASEGGH